jgi:hypothetical protein
MCNLPAVHGVLTRVMTTASRFPIALLLVAGAIAFAAMARPGAADARSVPGAPGCTLFPASSPWNQRVDQLPVAAGSAALMRSTGITQLHPDFSDSDGEGYGIPYNVVGASTPRRTVAFDYADESDHVGYPIPAAPRIEAGGDRHVLLLEKDSCRLYELYAAERRSNGTWAAGSGATWDLGSNALRPAGWTSADAAGLPILPGLARADEATASGGITHALRITLPVSQRAYLWPARHFASDLVEPWQAPMGLRIRIRPGYDISGFGPQSRAILLAGKRYGFIVADNGSAGYVSGAPAPGWDDDDLHALHGVPASAFEVVDTTAMPGQPAARRAWSVRFTHPTPSLVRANAFLTRSGHVTVEALRGGVVRSTRRVFSRQGYFRLDRPAVAGATWRIRLT